MAGHKEFPAFKFILSYSRDIYKPNRKLWSAVMKRSSITCYCAHYCWNWGRISIRGWTHKRHLTGELWDVFHWYFGENWLRYNSIALQCSYKYLQHTFQLQALLWKWNSPNRIWAYCQILEGWMGMGNVELHSCFVISRNNIWANNRVAGERTCFNYHKTPPDGGGGGTFHKPLYGSNFW